MRGSNERTGSLFSYVDLESRVRKAHPLRAIRLLVNETLASMEGEFAALYAGIGRPSIAPEKLLRAMLLQAFYSVRSERLLMERLEFEAELEDLRGSGNAGTGARAPSPVRPGAATGKRCAREI